MGSAAACAILKGVRIISAIALLLGLTLAGPAAADQRDPRLDDLFAQLKDAGDVHAAEVIEESIWHIWLESDDQAVRLLMADGLAAMGRQDYRAALGKFDQIVAIAPDFAEGWNKRATVNYLIGNYQGSLADIDKTLALEPRHFGALSGRGLVYMELDEERLALESFEAALQVHPLLPGAGQHAQSLRRRLHDRDI